jgi:surface antigen
VVQNDGNLVVYAADGQSVWASSTVNDRLASGEVLRSGQSLASASGQYRLVMQRDGNLVQRNASGRALWATNTEGNPDARLAMQADDGNLVVYAADGRPLWASGRHAGRGSSLVVQNDGNLVVYAADGQPVWASGGQGSLPPSDYPYPNAPDCDETPGSTIGCEPDMWGFYQGQCTSWVAYRLNQLNGTAFKNEFAGVHWGDASNWATAARQAGFHVNSSPALGAVAWFSGHVGYVERVNSDGSIVMSDMNKDLHNGFRQAVTLKPGERGWPSSFIHLKDR